MNTDLIDLKAAAAYLGLAQRSLRIMVKKGDVRAYAIGPHNGRLRFRQADLDDYVERSQVIVQAKAEAVRRPVAKIRPLRFLRLE
jgi:excisionase family DNA binding protein